MSNLRVEGLRKELILNPEFISRFIERMEKAYPVVANIMGENCAPLIGTFEPREAELVHILADGLLLTGSFVGVCFLHTSSLESFHFGDVDMVDTIAAGGDIDDETDGQYLLLQYELED